MVVMEVPTSLQAVEIRYHKADVLKVICRVTPNEVEY
jgi:glucose-6-phosphate 1-dehydrogenase